MTLKPIFVAVLTGSLLIQPLAVLAADPGASALSGTDQSAAIIQSAHSASNPADAKTAKQDPLSVIEGKLSISLSIVAKKALKLKAEGADISEARKYIIEARQDLYLVDPSSVATSTASSTVAESSEASSTAATSTEATSTSDFILKKPLKPLTVAETRDTLKKAQKAILEAIDALRKAIEVEQEKLIADSDDSSGDTSTPAATTTVSSDTSTTTGSGASSTPDDSASSTPATSSTAPAIPTPVQQ